MLNHEKQLGLVFWKQRDEAISRQWDVPHCWQILIFWSCLLCHQEGLKLFPLIFIIKLYYYKFKNIFELPSSSSVYFMTKQASFRTQYFLLWAVRILWSHFCISFSRRQTPYYRIILFVVSNSMNVTLNSINFQFLECDNFIQTNWGDIINFINVLNFW